MGADGFDSSRKTEALRHGELPQPVSDPDMAERAVLGFARAFPGQSAMSALTLSQSRVLRRVTLFAGRSGLMLPAGFFQMLVLATLEALARRGRGHGRRTDSPVRLATPVSCHGARALRRVTSASFLGQNTSRRANGLSGIMAFYAASGLAGGPGGFRLWADLTYRQSRSLPNGL